MENTATFSHPQSDDDWEAIRPTFTRYYIEERRTLPEVMEIMKQKHNFDARWVEVPNRPLAKLTAL